jgi:predicted DNA-binding transcriptional regulator AlpA
MKARCTCPTNPAFKDYGGRGIKVCERWLNSFENFLADMGERPSHLHSLDRWPDNDGDYEPGNCRWATAREQALNRRQRGENASARRISFGGETHTIREWSKITGIKWATIWDRLQHGQPPERALGSYLKQKDAKRIQHQGESMTIKEWSARLGIPLHTIYSRMARGKSTEEILRV